MARAAALGSSARAAIPDTTHNIRQTSANIATHVSSRTTRVARSRAISMRSRDRWDCFVAGFRAIIALRRSGHGIQSARLGGIRQPPAIRAIVCAPARRRRHCPPGRARQRSRRRPFASWQPPNHVSAPPNFGETVRYPGDGTHPATTGMTQSRGKPRPSDRSATPVAVLIPRDPNGYTLGHPAPEGHAPTPPRAASDPGRSLDAYGAGICPAGIPRKCDISVGYDVLGRNLRHACPAGSQLDR